MLRIGSDRTDFFAAGQQIVLVLVIAVVAVVVTEVIAVEVKGLKVICTSPWNHYKVESYICEWKVNLVRLVSREGIYDE